MATTDTSPGIPGPVFWYGGKGMMAELLLPLLPSAKVYVEAYGGAASLMVRRPPAPVEAYNDLNGDLVNLFRALQSPRRFRVLKRRLLFTPYSRQEFAEALRVLAEEKDPNERAWAFFTAQNQGFSGTAKSVGNWSRVFVSCRGMAKSASRWLGRLGYLDAWHRRFMRVQIDQRDALDVLRYWDSPETLFYLDPPYMAQSRAKGNTNMYAHEADDAHHAALLDLLPSLQGAVVLSGYDAPIYRQLDDAGWERREFKTACHAAGRTRNSGLQGAGSALALVPRTEVVWRNQHCLEMERRALPQLELWNGNPTPEGNGRD